MKKLLTGLVSVCAVIMIAIFVTGCGVTTLDAQAGTKVTAPTITNWYVYEEKDRLDTSVNVDFDQVKIDDIVSIKFTIYNNDDVLGTALSEGDNLVALLTDCEQYWNNTGDYKDTTGVRTISCAFTEAATANDNGEWNRSACTAKKPDIPTNLKVEIVVKKDANNNLRYTVNSNAG